jgi:hypothetical protein
VSISSFSRAPFTFVLITLLMLVGFVVASPETDKENTPMVVLLEQEGRFTVSLVEAPMADVVAELIRVTDIHVTLDDRLRDKRVTLSLADASFEELVTGLSGSTATVWQRGEEGDRVVSLLISAEEAVEPSLAEAQATDAEVESAAVAEQIVSTAATVSPSRLLLRHATIDTTQPPQTPQELGIPTGFEADPETEFYVVQFSVPLGAAIRAQLEEEIGVRITHYVPESAYAIKMTAEQRAQVAALDSVQHMEPFHPYFKMSGDIHAYLLSDEVAPEVTERVGRELFRVMLFRGEAAAPSLAVSGIEVETELEIGGRRIYTVACSTEHLEAILRDEGVQWVEPVYEAKALNDLANTRIGATRLRSLHPTLDGAGVIIGVTDSGIDFTHPGFALDPSLPTSTNLNTRIHRYFHEPSLSTAGTPGDTDGHGTHVAGSIIGNGALSATVLKAPGSLPGDEGPYEEGQFAGVAPASKVVMIEDFNSFTSDQMASVAYESGARIANNSWGWVEVYEYGLDSLLWDELVRDAMPDEEGNQEYIVFFSAGNDGSGNPDGTGGTAGTVGQPGNAKNVISVGAVEQKRYADNLDAFDSVLNSDSDWQVASYSARGPVAGSKRVKPDIVAPGSYMLSLQSQLTNPDIVYPNPRRDYRNGNVDSGPYYAFESGTSMASPIAAGAGALFFQHYTNAYGRAPSPAMMKAAMVSGARMLNSMLYTFPQTPDALTIVDQGWGMLDIQRAIDGVGVRSSDQVMLLDQSETASLQTGEFFTFPVTVAPGAEGLKVVLAWTDRPGDPTNAEQLVNDLDLVIQAPGGGGYRGNRFDVDGLHSQFFNNIPGAIGDRYNNVEIIAIPRTVPGTYTIQVYGHQIPEGPQDFAIAVLQGVGVEGQHEGGPPSLTLDDDENPVIAYATDVSGRQQIFAKRWQGATGSLSDFDTWKQLDGQWYSVGGSAESTGISQTLSDSLNPAVAAVGDRLFVAWEEAPFAPRTVSAIYFKEFDGAQWIDRGGSATGYGISGAGLADVDSTQAAVAVLPNGQPVVAWHSTVNFTDQRVFVAYWNGSAWAGYANSHTTGIPAPDIVVTSPGILIDSFGRVVVYWGDPLGDAIRVRRWNGGAWEDPGSVDSGLLASDPHVAAGDNGALFATWVGVDGALPGIDLSAFQVYAAAHTGAGFVPLGSATMNTGPGVSAAPNTTETTPRSPRIAGRTSADATVSYLTGAEDEGENFVLVKQFNGAGWSAYGNAGNLPGIDRLLGQHASLQMERNSFGIPVLAFENNATGAPESLVYTWVQDTFAPTFGGIATAAGQTNGTVRLTWAPALDNFTPVPEIVYHIYQSATETPCWDVPNCAPSSLFAGTPIATVTGQTAYVVSANVTPYQSRCYGVRAADKDGNLDENVVVRYASPVVGIGGVVVDCYDLDTDGDGISDWWEDLHFGSPTGANPATVNVPGGLSNLDAFLWETDPFSADTDADGLLDDDEVNIHGTDPSAADTDGDGIPDGMEVAIGSNPLHWDSNSNEWSDGDVYELGTDDPATAVASVNVLYQEDFETASANDWMVQVQNPAYPQNFWHLSTAGAVPAPAVATSVTYQVVGATVTPVETTRTWQNGPPILLGEPSATTSYRFANDPTASNPDATYSVLPPVRPDSIAAVLVSPRINAGGTTSLFVRWRENYDTEPNKDFLYIQARSDAQPDWVNVSDLERAGNSDGWQVGTADLSAFAGETGVQVRYLFTADRIDNHFKGWYVDDVIVYEAARVAGWVRDINGQVMTGAKISAISRGGITNVVDGHQVIIPGKVFGSTTSAADGSFLLTGLPFGDYYLKATLPGHRSEFYNGPLYDGAYGFGQGLNPGVFNKDEVAPGGIVNLAGPALAEVHFELERGDNQAFIGVAHAQALDVAINGVPTLHWNGGDTNTAQLIAYTAQPNLAALTNNLPDWDTNPVEPVLFNSMTEGKHRVGLRSPALQWRVAQPALTTRDGEITRMNVVTNAGVGFIQVVAADGGSYEVYVNGGYTGLSTPVAAEDLPVQAGFHTIQLVPGMTDVGVPAQRVHVPAGGRANVVFSMEAISGPTGGLEIQAVDQIGNIVTGLVIRLNGRIVNAAQTEDTGTSVLVTALREGFYEVGIQRAGYRRVQPAVMHVNAGLTGFVQFGVTQSDKDFDGVGDYTEITAFGDGSDLADIFMYSGLDMPGDSDMPAALKFEMFRQYGLILDPMALDSDGDGMSDGEEIGYNGYVSVALPDGREHLMFALSELVDTAEPGNDEMTMLFRGRYLDGISNFGVTNDPLFVASVEGDRFAGTNIQHQHDATAAFTTISGIPASSGNAYVSSSLDFSHMIGADVFADAMPDQVDTSGDGMWDGYKFVYSQMAGLGTNVHILDPIEFGGLHDDPDADGLTNLQEFEVGLADDQPLGMDPTNPDSDGDYMPDGWEFFYDLNPLDPADADEDPVGSGLTNYEEYLYGTNPRMVDTDGDGMRDGDEVFGSLNSWQGDAFFPEFGGSTDPLNPDTDRDGLTDGLEVLEFGTNPNRWDTSGDGMSDGFALLDPFGNLRPPEFRLNPLDPLEGARDASGDGMSNLENFLARDGLGQLGQQPLDEDGNVVVWDYWLDPFSTDTDGDGMPDVFEVFYSLHPMDPLPVEEGTVVRYPAFSASGDLDEDGLWNRREYSIRFLLAADADPFEIPGASTDPNNPDTDGDGVLDGHEWHSFSSSPLDVDTDGDGLNDGTQTEGVWGEVRAPRVYFQRYALIPVPAGSTWNDARALAQTLPHPDNPDVFADLAVFDNEFQFSEVLTSETAEVEQNIAVGAFAPVPVDGEQVFEWVNGMPFYDYFEEPIFPKTPITAVLDGAAEYGMLFNADSPDDWFTVDAALDVTVEYALVEWPHPDTRHYDRALNDMWVFNWPGDAGKGMPIWEQIVPEEDSHLPPPRWGHAASFIPGFERKNPNGTRYDPDAPILLDNRKLIVFGGRDGQDRLTDIWEYWIHANRWEKSRVTLPDMGLFSAYSTGYLYGASEWTAINLQGYSNTKSEECPCALVPWDCDGEEFGEPKDRPWNYGYQRSSYDLTYLFGGWNDRNEYLMPSPMEHFGYKGTDDPRPITDSMRVTDTAFDFFRPSVLDDSQNVIEIEFVVENNTKAGSFDVLPLGQYVAQATFAVENVGEVVREYVNTNVYVGLRFDRFHLAPLCDEVQAAILEFNVYNGPADDMEILIAVEKIGGESPGNYAQTDANGDFTQAPRQRLNWFTDVPPIAITIPAGFTGETSLDVTELVQAALTIGQWNGASIGFVLYTEQEAPADDSLLIFADSPSISVSYVPSYKINAEFSRTGQFQEGDPFAPFTSVTPSQRKSAGMVYDKDLDFLVVFGGIDGENVLGDLYVGVPRFSNLVGEEGEEDEEGNIGAQVDMRRFSTIRWTQRTPSPSPGPRWGHSMAYDSDNKQVILFGGFDAENKPLNDLWAYNVEEDQWVRIDTFMDGERPQPRGGAMIAFDGGHFYDRGTAGYVATARRRIAIFGGTDLDKYFNDTWVYNYSGRIDAIQTDETRRWILGDAGGEFSTGPSPRAFATMVYAQNFGGDYADTEPPRRAAGRVVMFGGRSGALPTVADTDQDLLADGVEHALGGPVAGRDPRVSRITQPAEEDESYPFDYIRIGTYPGNLTGRFENRGIVADFEVMSYEERLPSWRNEIPYQGYPIENSWEGRELIIGDETQFPIIEANTNRLVYNIGVASLIPDMTNLWYSRVRGAAPGEVDNVWEIGRPDSGSLGPSGAPPTGYRGRWVYGTNLRGAYANDATMDLYSPIMNLSIPSPQSTSSSNTNSYHLVFYEWVDLADMNDTIVVEAIRPVSGADVLTRTAATNKPPIVVVPERSMEANTQGEWRRVVVPLDAVANEPAVYLRFSLASDADGSAGGWYVDNIAVVQGGTIESTFGAVPDGTEVSLYGVASGLLIESTTTYDGGQYAFGLLPAGTYVVMQGTNSTMPIVIDSGDGDNFDLMDFALTADPASATVNWTAVIDREYQIEYIEGPDLLNDPQAWIVLDTVVANAETMSYEDTNALGNVRFYRVVLLPE